SLPLALQYRFFLCLHACEITAIKKASADAFRNTSEILFIRYCAETTVLRAGGNYQAHALNILGTFLSITLLRKVLLFDALKLPSSHFHSLLFHTLFTRVDTPAKCTGIA